MYLKITLIGALVLTLVVPFVLREEQDVVRHADDVVVIVTPHTETIRNEFARAFRSWYSERYGRSVRIDWRMPGGTSEIARYLASEYLGAFQNHWTRDLRRPWNLRVQGAFDNHAIVPGPDPSQDTEEEAARRAFLESEVSSGIDLLFGGGSFDHIRQASAGRLAPSRILERRPEWFGDDVIPPSLSGEPFRDPEGRWIGVVLSSFGLIYNTDALGRLGIETTPVRWEDLSNPKLRGQVAVADPSKSGSIAKAFEMMIQEQMQNRLTELGSESRSDNDEIEARAVREGWDEAMRLIRRIGGNARFFTDSASKPAVDVALGDAAAGMAIDFYGRYQQEVIEMRTGESRFKYRDPEGGTVFSVDPIALLRGAPNREVAEAFIEFSLSMEGQKLWNLRPGTEGGPTRFALRRLPIRRDFYVEELTPLRSDPEAFPYDHAEDFVYHSAWTAPIFREMRFLIRVMCLDAGDELREAWRELIRADFPPRAMELFDDVSLIDYDTVLGPIREATRSPDRIDEVRLSKNLIRALRGQFRDVAELARRGE